jgi:D-amino-acid dehydrogenase
MSQIAIIGAGITGVTTAYALLDRGYKVTIFDRHRYAAMETSFANGGQLSASNAEVWNNTSTVIKGLRWMFKRDAPLSMNPKPPRDAAPCRRRPGLQPADSRNIASHRSPAPVSPC